MFDEWRHASRLAALDVETECAVPGCSRDCVHALLCHAARVTVAAIWTPTEERIVRADDSKTLARRVRAALREMGVDALVGHALKFDLKMLWYQGVDLGHMYHADSAYIANLCSVKVSREYREWYAVKRRELNKRLPKGRGHRDAKGHSLKILAPYFLKVRPFWEDPTNHDDDAYVMRDAEYSYRLHERLMPLVRRDLNEDFYWRHMMPDARLLLRAECRGVTIDREGLMAQAEGWRRDLAESQEAMRARLRPVHAAWRRAQEDELRRTYDEKRRAFVSNGRRDGAKALARYRKLADQAVSRLPTEFNLNSPPQVAWIMDHVGADPVNAEGKRSTGKAVLNRLAEKVPEAKLMLEVREKSKLLNAFVDAYAKKGFLDPDDVVRTTFHLENVRTGRTSSSGPNFQQVPPEVRRFFVPRPGHVFVTYDMSAIEAKLIAWFTESRRLFRRVRPGQDFHGHNVANIYFPELGCPPAKVKERHPAERDFGKRLGYALFYGARRKRVRHTSFDAGLGWSEARCQAAVDRFDRDYARVLRYKQGLDEQARRAVPIESMFGRHHRYWDPEDVHMKAFNTQVQFAASELLLWAARRVQRAVDEADLGAQVVLVVHDEMVVEVPKEHAGKVASLVQDALTRKKLMTKHGRVVLECEGGVMERWTK